MRRAELLVEAYNRMGYGALGVGSFDLAAGIDNLKKLEARARFPFLSANLVDGSTGKLYFKPHVIAEVAGAKIGVIGLTLNTMSRTYLDKVAPNAQLLDPVEAARKSLDAMRGQVDAVIALSHLREETSSELATKLPELEIIIDPYIQYGNHHTWIKEEEWVGYRDSTLFLRGDGQGSRLGVLDIRILEPRAKLFSEDRLAELEELASGGTLTEEQKAEKATFAGKNLFRFLRISLEPHHGTDPDFEQLYQKWLQKVDPSTVPVLADPLPGKGNFLTVEGCKSCHEPQYDRWLKTRHAEAFATLVQSGDDAQYDCVGCHSVGYGAAFLQMADIGAYANVQCESCHGTSPEHAKEPEKHRFGPVARETCMTCHNKEVLDKDFDFFTQKKLVQCPKG
jgi:hypothetical protein